MRASTPAPLPKAQRAFRAKAPGARPTDAPAAIATARANRVCDFIEKFVIVAEGVLVGKPMKLLPEQRAFIQDVYGNLQTDGRLLTRRGILSVARKNGKTGLVSSLVLAHLVGPEAKPNSQIYSAARSRDQAALVYGYALKSINMSPKLSGLVKPSPSHKGLTGLPCNVQYRALSAEATTAHGLSPALTIHDELGQVIGPSDALYDALETAGGAQEEPLSLIISTQAPTDQDLLSIIIDDALRAGDPRTVCHLYEAPRDTKDIFDPKVWARANFALGKFRSLEEFREAAERAKRLPSFESTFRNLYLNMRIARDTLFISPEVWKDCGEAPDERVFMERPVYVGLDLSARTDLTVAVFAAEDENQVIHLKVVAFTPSEGLEERAKVDRVPYPLWVSQGYLHTIPGRVIDYRAAAEHLREISDGMNIVQVDFDRWRIDLFHKEAEEVGFGSGAVWVPVGQGFKDMSPRLEGFEQRLLERSLRHGLHPVLNMAASGAVAVRDAAGNRKLEKSKSSARIDALVAAVMAVGAFDQPEDSNPHVGGESIFFLG